MDTQTQEDVTLKEINPQAEDIAGSLGISTERRDELCDIIKRDFHTHDTVTQDMVALSKDLKGHQELAFAMFVYGCWFSDQGYNNPLAALIAAHGRMN